MPDFIQVPEQYSIWLSPLQCNPPPRILWRINDRYSKAQRNNDGDLRTASHEISSSWHGLREAIMKHLSNRKSLSCFMSLTSDKTHARGLAIKRARHIQDPFQYSDNSDDLVRYEIDTKCVHAHIYKVVDLLCVFHIPVPSYRDISTEYLILKEIPGEAIVDTSTIKAMRMESVPDDEDDDEPLEGEELKPIIPRDTRQRRSWRSRFAYRNGKIIEEAEDMTSKDPMMNN